MSNLEYNGQVLTKARRELKLKADDIATELCLSVQQVQAIENNLGAFFHSNKLKQAVIKRYCQFLNIDVNTVITQYETDVTDNTFQEIKKNTSICCDSCQYGFARKSSCSNYASIANIINSTIVHRNQIDELFLAKSYWHELQRNQGFFCIF